MSIRNDVPDYIINANIENVEFDILNRKMYYIILSAIRLNLFFGSGDPNQR